MTHICVRKLTTIGSDNGLSPGRRQATIWTNAGILLILTWGTNFSEILSDIYTFSFKKMHLKMSPEKRRTFCYRHECVNSDCYRANEIIWRISANITQPGTFTATPNKAHYCIEKCSDQGRHYIDVIMTTMASQITSLTVVYSIVYPDSDQRKHQSYASLAFVWGSHRDRWIPAQRASYAENVSIWWRHHEHGYLLFSLNRLSKKTVESLMVGRIC